MKKKDDSDFISYIKSFKSTNLYIVLLALALFLFSTHSSGAVENIFYIDSSRYPLSKPSKMANLDDGLSIAVINRDSKKISKVKHNQVVFERAIENFTPFDLIAVNGELFVSCKELGEVKVLSQVDFSLIKTIPISKSTTYMTLSSDRSKILVASPLKSADTIGIIDISSKKLLSPPLYGSDFNLVNRLFTHNGKLFVTSLISSSIVVFDEKTLKHEGTHNFGFIPDYLVVTDTHLYLSSVEEQLIRIVDLQSFEKVKDIPFNGFPGKMVFDEKQYIYVLNSDRTGKVFRLDTLTNEFDDNSCFESGNCFYTNSDPKDAVISKDGKVLYVANSSANSITYHFISGKLFIEPRTFIVKPGDSNSGSHNSITLKAGGGSSNYSWSAPYGKLEALSGEISVDGNQVGEEVIFIPPFGEDIYYVTVTDNDSFATASAEIIVVDIRVTPKHKTVPNQNPEMFNITGGTPPYEASALQGGTIVHSPGESVFTFSPPAEDGIYTIEIRDRNGAKGYTTVEMASEGVNMLPIDASRAAIIVAGGPPLVNQNKIWPEIKFAAEGIYRLLKENGFTKDQIYLLSPDYIDGDGDGFSDDGIIRNTKGFLEEKNIQSAFQWAGQLQQLDQPLLVFLLGHGNTNQFMLNLREPKHVLEAQQLKQYLEEYQQTSGKKVVVVIDSCYSGSFIDDLAGTGRAIITSTGEGKKSFYTMDDNKTSLHSFISYFSQGLKQRDSFLKSYEYASEEVKKFYSEAICSTKQYLFQNPQYADNGDVDLLKKFYIQQPAASKNSGKNRSSDGTETITPKIADTTLSVVSMNSKAVDTFSPGSPITLKAKVGFAQDSIKSVYGILKPPGMTIPIDENGIIQLSYPRIKLSKTDVRNLESYNSEIWETQWNGAVYQGCYEINFYAQSENGSIAFSDAVSFSVSDSGNDLQQPPNEPSIEILLNGNESSDGYSPGTRLNISLIEHLSWGYDLYAAIILPDGVMWSLSGLNQKSIFTGGEESIVSWQGERHQNQNLIVFDIEIPEDLPKGQYQVYAVMAPHGSKLLDTSTYWKLSVNSFFIKP